MLHAAETRFEATDRPVTPLVAVCAGWFERAEVQHGIDAIRPVRAPTSIMRQCYWIRRTRLTRFGPNMVRTVHDYRGDGESRRGNRIEVNNAGNNLASGDAASGLESCELVEIKQVAPFGGKALVQGVGIQSRRMVRHPVAAAEFADLVKVRRQRHTWTAILGFSSSPRQSGSASLTSSNLSSR